MLLSDAVCTELLGYSALTDIVSTRIYQVKLPQNTPYPAVTSQLIGGEPIEHTSEADTGNPLGTRYQVTAFAKDLDTAQDAAVEVKNCLEDFTGSLGSGVTVQRIFLDGHPVELWNEAPEVWQVSQDFLIWWVE